MRVVLVHAAVLLTMYEIQPPQGKKWEVAPRTTRRAAARHPANKVLAWIKRRPLPVDGEKGS